MGLSHYIIPTAYIGYLTGYGIVFAGRVLIIYQLLIAPKVGRDIFLWLSITIVAFITASLYGWLVDDILRDCGAVLSFVVGRVLIFPRKITFPYIRTLIALSRFGNLLVLLVFTGAFFAYKNGASAYLWRGSYVPFINNWLPFLIAVNVGLQRIGSPQSWRYIFQAVFCVLGTLISLSRTDLLLEIFFGLALVCTHWRRFFTPRGLVMLFLAILLSALILPAYLNLDVVQERLNRGVSADQDMSMGWRFMENESLYVFLGDSVTRWALGMGIGARLPLPSGTLDFNGNSSIPFLHNSFLTIILKTGILGLLGFIFYLTMIFRRSCKMQSVEAKALYFIGAWIILFVLGKAISLQGLTEWSHVFFFGFGACLIARSKFIENYCAILTMQTNITIKNNDYAMDKVIVING
ncbi:MAG: hypothetical protein IPN42_19410 [Methylococcaceae bacterium]|nr:hypothetical protein [Methylococcaceae bacterium]